MLRPTRRFCTAGLVPFVALAAIGCGAGGADDEHIGVAGAADEAAEAGSAVPLPTLPPIGERLPDAYDGQGCTRIGPAEVDCSSTAADLDRTAADPADGWRTLAGFVGPHFVTTVTSGAVVLLDGTDVASSTGPWTATGLVRNETTASVGAVVVDAVLVAADGTELADVESRVAVDPLRAGEPAPFRISADVASEQVADVRWSVTSGAPRSADDGRVLELVTWWERNIDDPEPVDLYLYRDAPDAPLPYLLYGATTNHAPTDVDAPIVVAAWLDDLGRVVAVEQTDAITDPVASTGGAPLAPGVSADFLFVLGDERHPAVDAARVMLWGVGR